MNLKTSLYQTHVDLGARMVPFAGFDMPIQYSSLKEEALAVRNSCGVFDVSHMGEFFINGPEAVKFADYMITNDFSSAEIGKAVYSPLCREDGTVIDDLIMYKLADDRVMVCVNASNIEKDWKVFEAQKNNFDASLKNESENFSLLAIQGPRAIEVLQSLELDIPDNVFSVKESSWRDDSIIIARTGYTGEDGAEVFCGHKTARTLWDELLKRDVVPAGLGARDVLRIEACYPLYGHEIHDDVTPLDAALKWTVKLNKENFSGLRALSDYSPKYKLVKLILDKGIPRENYEVLGENQEVIGHITSGTMSVVLNKGIALAHVARDAKIDEKVIVNIRNKHYDAQILKTSFLNHWKNTSESK